tara:strand:- start:150 stop:359 length:210 start_codon:yes stop_codon:yes gene_type:complete
MLIIENLENLSKEYQNKRISKRSREYRQLTIDNKTHTMLKSLSEKYRLPMSRLVTLMTSDLFKKVKENK